ncbi:hypothetical protein L0664_11455 [Octadecabacter sp. G9-8]|uniref:Lipoprotein n=1 Tax=Octadecabacter dasysiphoniae TaxID=2909341 RepID=A0ABS9D047_9RHOB|nr:hypothetical protein [Octadecabacter dasysiphoniae]MCF2871683.1 hypothetical protein [Octadecabacter dasysiphoniae]
MRMLPLFIFAPLMGCTSLVMSTVVALDDLDPMTADPAGFEVALDIPDPLGLVKNSTEFQFTATRGETGDVSGGEYTLLETTTPDGHRVYRIPQNAVEDIRAIQKDAATWQATGDNALSVGVNLDFCRTTQDPLPDDLRFSIFIRLAQDAPLLPLVRNSRVTEVIEAEALNELDMCADP